MNKLEFAVWLRKIRKALGKSQLDFGEAIGRNSVSISNYEKGKTLPKDPIGFKLNILEVYKEEIEKRGIIATLDDVQW